MTTSTLEEIVARAVALLEAATSGDEFDAIWDVVEPAATMGQPALDAGIALLAGSVEQRQAGCAILGALCYSVNNGRWEHQVGVALAAAAALETDADAAWSIAKACQSVHDPVTAPALIALAHHADRDVRSVVATALTSAQDFASKRNPQIAAALLFLMQDDWDEIRDWATFGLGTQLNDDSAEIRDAFVALLDDPHVDTRHEALMGLARRRDPRGLQATLAFLETPDVWRLSIEAAGYYASPLLLPALLDLRDDDEDPVLEASIAACDPVAQASERAVMAELLDKLLPDLNSLTPARSASLVCELFSTDTTVIVGSSDYGYDLTNLLDRGGVDEAVRHVREHQASVSLS